MGQHLSDLSQELQYERYLNLAKWLNFTTPQQAYAWRQNEYQQRLLMNRAEFAGYATADQFISFLQKEVAGNRDLNTVMLQRAALYKSETDAALGYTNALSGTHASIGQLGEGLLPGAQQFQSALAGLPAEVTTRLQIEDSAAISEVAGYEALLHGIPREITTREVLTAAQVRGAVPVTGVSALPQSEVIPVSFGGPYAEQFAAILAEVARLDALRAEIPVHFDLPDAAAVSAFVSSLPAVTESVHLVSQGGAVGVGAGPPPETVAAWNALDGAEAQAAAEGHLAGAAQLTAGDAAAGAVPKVAALAAAWEKLSAAEKDAASHPVAAAGAAGGAGGAGNPPPAAPAPGADEPPPDAAAKWAALASAEKAAGDDAAAAAAKLEALAHATDDADAASKFMYAAQIAQGIASSTAGDEAKAGAVQFITLAAAQDDAGNAAKLAYSAQLALGGELARLKGNTDTAAAGFGTFAQSLIQVGGWFGWLGTKVALFGGLLSIGLWHIMLDAIIETIAMFALAAIGVLAMAAAIGIFVGAATLAQDTLGRISDRLKAVYTAASATGQAIYPMSNAFDKLASVLRPEVWQLYGDALNLVGNHMGLIGPIAEKTGAFLDTLAAKIIVFVSNPAVQNTFANLIKSGVAMAEQFGRIFSNLGQAFLNFLKVMNLTHIAEDLVLFGVAVSKLIDIVSKLPTPLLALALGLHAVYLWGGLAVTGVVALLDPLRSLALAVGGVDAANTAMAGLSANASGLDRLKAVLSDVGTGFGGLGGRISGTTTSLKDVSASSGVAADDLTRLKTYAAATGTALSDLVPATMTAKVATLGENLDQAGKDSLTLAAAAGASGAGLEKLAADSEAAAGKGGLLAGVFSSLGPALASPVTWILAAVAALTFLSVEILRANDNTQLWIKSMDDQLTKTSLYTVIGQTVSDLAAATQKLAIAQHGGAGNASELAAAQSDLSGKLGAELVHVGQVSTAYGVNMVGALNLLQVAGVKTDVLFTQNNKTWAAAMVQVAGLVQGYKAMGQGLTQLQGDVSVQLVMNADQLAQMNTLNTAWDSWLKLVEAGPSAFVAFIQGVQTVSANMAAAGASFGGTNAASLTLRASWASLIPQAGAVQDAIRQYSAVLQNGAQGSAMLVTATKDIIASSGQLGTTNQQVPQLPDCGGGGSRPGCQHLAEADAVDRPAGRGGGDRQPRQDHDPAADAADQPPG